MTSAWSRWLEQLETSLTAQRAALADGRPDAVVAGEPPQGLGPLPVELESRARAALRHHEVLTAELAAACAAQGRQLKLLAALSHRTPGACFLDARG